MQFEPGQRLGEWVLLERVGAGGFSIVFKARNESTGETAALKIPRVPEFTEHLRREARLATEIEHPRIVPVLAADLERDPPLLVMPFLEGSDLEMPGQCPPVEGIVLAFETAREILVTLVWLHARGIVHGDLKPGNIRRDRDGTCHILDLGLAKLQVRTRRDRSLAHSVVSVEGHDIAGTLAYMAPELLERAEPSPASDIYAIGVLLHHLLTGQPPAFGVSPRAVNPFLPAGTEDLLRSMLRRRPYLRATATEAVFLLDALIGAEQRCLARRNGHARRRVFEARMATLKKGLRPLAIAVCAVAAVVLAVEFGSEAAAPFLRHAPRNLLDPLKAAAIFGLIGLGALGLLLGITTINAYVLGVPEKTYKNRKGHRIWTFMMQ